MDLDDLVVARSYGCPVYHDHHDHSHSLHSGLDIHWRSQQDMSQRIWIFGDSFANDHYKGDPVLLEQQWHRIIGRELDMLVENRARSGTSLDWLYYQWHQTAPRIDQKDVVIIAVTSTNRRWLLKDQPHFSSPISLANGVYDQHIGRNEKQALEQYFRYLHHDLMVPALIRNWLYSLQCIAREKSLRVLLLPAFDTTHQMIADAGDLGSEVALAQGDLMSVSQAEYLPHLQGRVIFDQDGRNNHLLPVNHRVLVDKIKQWYSSAAAPDLKQGFHESLLNERGGGPFAREHRVRFM